MGRLRTQLVASVVGPDPELAHQSLIGPARLADLIEIRLDTIRDPDVAALVRASPRPVVLTDRGRDLDRLKRGVEAGAVWVDLDLDQLDRYGRVEGARHIVSLHDHEGTPENLESPLRRLDDTGADVTKFVTSARDLRDAARVLACLAARPTGGSAIHAMGAAGSITRLVGPKFGTAFTYASTRAKAEAAPGQPTIRQLREVYRTHRVGPSTRLYALLGAVVEHSLSPAVHNAAFEALGVDAAYVALACSDPTDAWRVLPADLFAGFSVTAPHKEAAAAVADQPDRFVERIGAANTLRRVAAGLEAYNTDGLGAVDAIRAASAQPLDGRVALVVGAGGAARAVAAALVDAGCDVSIVARRAERAAAVASAVGASSGAIADADWPAAEIVVHATPAGGADDLDGLVLDPGQLRRDVVVLDVVYRPERTRLLRAVRERGGRAVSGIEMFRRQAQRQIAIWTERDEAAISEIVGDSIRREIALEAPIALIGLRGAGKTTLGARLAARLGRRFVDTDASVTDRTGRTPGAWLRDEGEARFRDVEAAAVAEALRIPGAVVALGGGAPLAEATRRCLADAAARIAWLDAADEILRSRIEGDAGRPRLTDQDDLAVEIARLRAARASIFAKLADRCVRTDAAEGEEDALERLVRWAS